MGISFWLAFERSRGSRPRRPRTLVALAVVALAFLLPAVALASHQFGDVPTTHTFHNNISALANAGITGGCGGGNFCPDAPVTRGQMAGFLARALPRVAENEFVDSIVGGGPHVFGSVTITPTAAAGGVQYVVAQFNGGIVVSDDVGCPCQIGLTLRRGSELLNTGVFYDVPAGGGGYHPVSAGGVIQVTGSAPVTISVRAAITQHEVPTADTEWGVYGNIVVLTIPFGSAHTPAP
jgi:hypothetical protein